MANISLICSSFVNYFEKQRKHVMTVPQYNNLYNKGLQPGRNVFLQNIRCASKKVFRIKISYNSKIKTENTRTVRHCANL